MGNLYDPKQKDLATIAASLAGKVGTGQLTREQVAAAIVGTPELRARMNYQGDSKNLTILDSLFKNGSPVTPQSVVNALDRTAASGEDKRAVRYLLENVDIVDNMIAETALTRGGFTPKASSRLLSAISRIPGKRALGVAGGLLTGFGKLAVSEAAGIAGDVLQGTPPGAPGGLSDAELPGTTIREDATPEERMAYQRSYPEQRSFERQEIRQGRREARRLDREDRTEEVLEEARSMEGESEIIRDASSPTSGNNNMLRSFASLIGRR